MTCACCGSEIPDQFATEFCDACHDLKSDRGKELRARRSSRRTSSRYLDSQFPTSNKDGSQCRGPAFLRCGRVPEIFG